MKNQSYLAWARKYRPQSFAEVLGQKPVSDTLSHAVGSGKVAQAYLFVGSRGVGKTTMARILAKALNCKKGPAPTPCGACDPCREIAASSSIDVVEMDAASHTGVDNVREAIIDTVALSPSRDRYKVFIIDEAHMLSNAAFNALLKTLEEPPAHVVFVLATTESAKIPATVASRCQKFRFRPLSEDSIVGHLSDLARREDASAEPEALRMLARSAQGSLRDAVSLLDQAHTFADGNISANSVREMLGLTTQERLARLARSLAARDAAGLWREFQSAYEEGLEPAQVLRDLREALQKLALGAFGAAKLDPLWEPLVAQTTVPQLQFFLRRLNKALEEIRSSDSPRLTAELGLYSCLEAAADLGQWIERLETLERRLSSGSPAPASMIQPHRLPTEPQSAAAATPTAAWQSAMASFRDKPALFSSLDKAQLHAAASGPWRLVFAKEFDLKAVERHKSAVEAILATMIGGPVAIKLELGTADSKTPPDPEPAAESTPLNEAAKYLGGKVRFVKKP